MRRPSTPLLVALCLLAGPAWPQQAAHPSHALADIEMHHPSPPGGKRVRVAVLLYEHAVLQDWAIPADIFRTAGHGQAFDVYLVSETGEPVATPLPTTVAVDYSIADAPAPDVIVVPGGNWMALTERTGLHDWLRRSLARGATIFSICTGAYVLAQAGLLDGREATSLHAQLDILEQLAPRAIVRRDVPFVLRGGVLTAAGAATAIPATLLLIERLAGKEAADFMSSEFLDFDNVLDPPSVEPATGG